MAEQTLRYVTSRWGAPTQTFVRREALAVASERAVTALSIKPPAPSSADGIIECDYLPPLTVARLVTAAFIRHPKRTSRILATVLRRARPRNMPSLLAAAATGVAWSQAGLTPPSVWLHAHFGWVAATATWAAAEMTGARYSIVLHAFELHRSQLNDSFTPVPLRRAARVFTISERDRAVVEERWGIDASVLRMGVPRGWMEADRTPREDDLVVAVGSLVPKKGHHVLLEAMARTEAPWRAVIVGEGPERTRLEKLVDALGLSSRVELVGHCSEQSVRRLLSRATVACLACVESPDGDLDGIPVSLMEAMAAGVPVLTTSVSAIPELVEGVGLLVPPNDPGALAAAMDRLVDEKLCDELAALGRERIVDGGWLVEDAAPTVAALGSRRPVPA